MDIHDHIHYLSKALGRNNAVVDSMLYDVEFNWGADHCCPDCYYGKKLSDIYDKIDRQEAWLKILKDKVKKRNESSIHSGSISS